MENVRIQDGIGLYYLTFTVTDWLPIFIATEPCLIVTDSLNHCHHNRFLRVNAFVIMPTHLHLILFDADFNNQRLQQTVNDMRRHMSRQLLAYSDRQLPKVYQQGFQSHQRQDRKRQFWQPSRHPVGLVSQRMWQTKLDYLHDNPRRKGLVREGHDWRFSSAGYWLGVVAECGVVLSGVRF